MIHLVDNSRIQGWGFASVLKGTPNTTTHTYVGAGETTGTFAGIAAPLAKYHYDIGRTVGVKRVILVFTRYHATGVTSPYPIVTDPVTRIFTRDEFLWMNLNFNANVLGRDDVSGAEPKLVAFTYANEADRIASAAFTFEDIGKLSYQTDTEQTWELVDLDDDDPLKIPRWKRVSHPEDRAAAAVANLGNHPMVFFGDVTDSGYTGGPHTEGDLSLTPFYTPPSQDYWENRVNDIFPGTVSATDFPRPIARAAADERLSLEEQSPDVYQSYSPELMAGGKVALHSRINQPSADYGMKGDYYIDTSGSGAPAGKWKQWGPKLLDQYEVSALRTANPGVGGFNALLSGPAWGSSSLIDKVDPLAYFNYPQTPVDGVLNQGKISRWKHRIKIETGVGAGFFVEAAGLFARLITGPHNTTVSFDAALAIKLAALATNGPIENFQTIKLDPSFTT